MPPEISMAPLRGVTVREFRDLYASFFGGVDFALAPFISLPPCGKFPAGYFNDVAGPNPVLRTVPQVIGKDPERLTAAASYLRDLGFDEMNLNCGCPWKFVAAKGRGSGLPENEELFGRMLDAGCASMPGGFSVKIRLGRFSPDTLSARIPLINGFPLKNLIIHPRTGAQMYNGDVDLNRFSEAINLLSPEIPVTYNGDIRSLDDYKRIVRRFPTLSGVMIGRGLVSNPFLASEIAEWENSGRPDFTAAHRTIEKRSAFFDFSEALYSKYKETLFGPAPVLGRMKEYWKYAACFCNHGKDGLTRILRSRSLEEYESAVFVLRRG